MHFPLLHVLYLALILNELKLHGMYCRNATVCDFSEPRYGIQWVCVRPLEELCPREMNWYEKEFAKNKILLQLEVYSKSLSHIKQRLKDLVQRFNRKRAITNTKNI